MSKFFVKSSKFILIGLLSLVACMHKIPNPPKSNNSLPITDSSICFERDILPIFISNCTQANCHGAANAQDGYILTDYNSIIKKGIRKGNASESKIYKVLIEQDLDDRMPLAPNAALTATQINSIKKWIDEGAQNTTNCIAVECDTNLFTYSGAITTIINDNCIGCHNSNTQSGGIRLDNYNEVKSVVNSGRLLGSIKRESGFSAMPQGGAQLSNCKIIQIEKWIANNAPNN